jgi:predicted metal-dependent hydrolase
MPDLPPTFNGRPTTWQPGEPPSPSPTCGDQPPAALRHGIAQFNRGEYYQCHETLEDAWKAERAPIRQLYQGILQVGVALHHLRYGNYIGANKLLTLALGYLRQFVPACLGVDVARLIDDAEQLQARLQQLGPTRITEFDQSTFPTISLTE